MKVEAERSYHQVVLQILDQLEGEVNTHRFIIFIDITVIFLCY
jgi:hypothetical protein